MFRFREKKKLSNTTNSSNRFRRFFKSLFLFIHRTSGRIINGLKTIISIGLVEILKKMQL